MVMQEKKYKLLIDDLSAIKYEEESEFENSVSADAYEKAYAITKKILRENKKFRELKNKSTTGNKLRNSEQIYNILFFTGAKGSGKTSTMLSYMEYLKDFYRKSDKGENKLSSNFYTEAKDIAIIFERSFDVYRVRIYRCFCYGQKRGYSWMYTVKNAEKMERRRKP